MNNSIYSTKNGIIPVSVTSQIKTKESNVIDSLRYSDQTNTLTIINAFTGTKIMTSNDIISNMEALKLFIAQHFKIGVDRLFLLTPFGIKLKFSMVVNEQVSQIYVFDRKFFTPALLKSGKKDSIIEELLNSIQNEELLNLIQPRESPVATFNNSNFDIFLGNTLSLTSDSIINSSDLDFDGLRLFLNLIKRNSGWASALVSDMETTLFNDVYHHDYETIESILNSLNSLVQYVSNLEEASKKEMNTLKNVFTSLVDSSMVDTWKNTYELLGEIRVGFKENGIEKDLFLSDFVNQASVEASASNLKVKKIKTDQLFKKLNTLFEDVVIVQKESILNDFESYKTRYLKPEWESSEKENIKKANEIYTQLRKLTTQMVDDMKDLPSFENMITTTNNMSTFLSRDSVNNIIRLAKIYNTHRTTYIPSITSLADELYKIQRKFYESREELQKRIVHTTLVSFVHIQLSLREVTDIISSSILTTIEEMQHDELQLTLVKDLPLIFGIWMISVLSNRKYGAAMKRLARRTNEVLEMMNFIEQSERRKWFESFIDSIGLDQNKLQFLTDPMYKEKFVDENLFQFIIVPNDNLEEHLHMMPQIEPKRHNSDTIRYLSPFNKLLQNINNLPIKNKVDQISQNMNIESKTPSENTFIGGLIENITLEDVIKYIHQLENHNYHTKSLEEMKVFLQNIGIQGVPTLDTNKYIIKSGNLDDLGAFNSEDSHYMRVFKKFITSFRFNHVEIDVKIDSEIVKKPLDKEAYLTAAYEERIQKLERMLLDNKFQLFDHKWSQFYANGISENIMDLYPEGDEVIIAGNTLGRNKIRLPPNHYTQKMASLEVENQQLKSYIKNLEKSKEVGEINHLNTIIDEQETYIKQLQMIDLDNKRLIKLKDQNIMQLNEHIEKQQVELEAMKIANDQFLSDIDELTNMNKDLIENMSHKEVEYLNENQQSQKEKNFMQIRIEELQDMNNQFEKIMANIHELDDLITSLVNIVVFMVLKLQGISQHLYANMRWLCLILEMMGLMLVDENGKLDIHRVKGLRLQKKKLLDKNVDVSEEWEHDDQKLFMEVVASKLANRSGDSVDWIPMLGDDFDYFTLKNKSDLESLNLEPHESDGDMKLQNFKVKEIISVLSTLNNTKLKLKYIVSVFNQDELEIKYEKFITNTIIPSSLLLPKIHHRFEDVETLARKLQREKVQLKADIKILNKKISQQLVLRNFEVGDLVLFLRTFTLNDSSSKAQESEKEKQPWAIFNVGSPNYYLRPPSDQQKISLNNKDWFIGRLTGVIKHVVTSETRSNVIENPFNLAVDTVWYFVETGEESKQ